MSADADLILEKIDNLSLSELLSIRAKIDAAVVSKKSSDEETLPIQNKKTVEQLDNSSSFIYTRTPEEIEAFLASILTPEELKRAGKTDFSKIHIGPKSASQMLIEDREDRV